MAVPSLNDGDLNEENCAVKGKEEVEESSNMRGEEEKQGLGVLPVPLIAAVALVVVAQAVTVAEPVDE